jgi:hypothetical protein
MSGEMVKKEPQAMQMMGGMGELFQNMMMPNMKQISPDSNFLTRIGHKWRVRDFERIAEGEANIVAHQARSFDTMMTVFGKMATFNERLKLQFEQIDHYRAMMSLEQKEKQAVVMGMMLDNELKQGKVKQLDLENKISEMEHEVRLNELRDYMNGKK